MHDDVLDRILAHGPGAVVVAAKIEASSQLVRALRERRFEGPIFGTSSMGRAAFLEMTGGDAEGVIFPTLVAPGGSHEFSSRFTERTGRPPDFAALQTYDAVRLLVSAMRAAGLNRARIRDALRELSPWNGVAGTVDWDPVGQNRRMPGLATIRSGQVQRIETR